MVIALSNMTFDLSKASETIQEPSTLLHAVIVFSHNFLHKMTFKMHISLKFYEHFS